ncbi:MAG: hypothetical protein QMD14_00855 [Candidatus Aenigmarchaeota archaeon]|nr:hypothetical protein [Candidatus Aenigmarchaeota archaeon]
MPLLLKTERGNFFKSLGDVILTVDENGNPVERYVSEVQPYQTIFVRKKGPVSNVEEIEGIMKRKVPGYLHGFEFINMKSDGNYIRRLRYDLFKSLLSLAPHIFTSEEIERFDDYLFKRKRTDEQGNAQELDFSQKTYSNAINYLDELMRGYGIIRTRATYRYRLENGMHIEDPDEGVKLGEVLKCKDLIERSKIIRDTPKDMNPYWIVVDVNRVMSARYGELVRYKKRSKVKKTPYRKGHTHTQFPEWFSLVKKELEGRERENIVETKLMDIELITSQPTVGEEKQKKQKSDTGVEIGILSYNPTDDNLRESLYNRLRLPTTKSRITKLKEDIADRCELTKELYERIGLLLIDSTKQAIEKFKGGISYPDFVFPVSVLQSGDQFQVYFPIRHYATFLDPLLGYKMESAGFVSKRWHQTVYNYLTDRDYRREFDRAKKFPKGDPLRNTLSQAYEQSFIFRSMFTDKEEFIRRCARLEMVDEVEELRQLFREFMNAQSHGLSRHDALKLAEVIAGVKDTSRYMLKIAQDGNVQSIGNKIKERDFYMPKEVVLTLFSAFLTPLAYTVDEESLPELTDTGIRVLQFHGIDGSWTNKKIRDIFEYVFKRINELQLFFGVNDEDIIECYKRFFCR